MNRLGQWFQSMPGRFRKQKNSPVLQNVHYFKRSWDRKEQKRQVNGGVGKGKGVCVCVCIDMYAQTVLTVSRRMHDLKGERQVQIKGSYKDHPNTVA